MLGDPAELAARVEAGPDDHDARYRLATVLFLRGQAEAAMEHLTQIVKRDREWEEDKARKQLVKFFEPWAQGPGDAQGPPHALDRPVPLKAP